MSNHINDTDPTLRPSSRNRLLAVPAAAALASAALLAACGPETNATSPERPTTSATAAERPAQSQTTTPETTTPTTQESPETPVAQNGGGESASQISEALSNEMRDTAKEAAIKVHEKFGEPDGIYTAPPDSKLLKSGDDKGSGVRTYAYVGRDGYGAFTVVEQTNGVPNFEDGVLGITLGDGNRKVYGIDNEAANNDPNIWGVSRIDESGLTLMGDMDVTSFKQAGMPYNIFSDGQEFFDGFDAMLDNVLKSAD